MRKKTHFCVLRNLIEEIYNDTDRHTDTQTDTQTHRVTTEGTLSGFQDFFLQPIIKDRPKNEKRVCAC